MGWPQAPWLLCRATVGISLAPEVSRSAPHTRPTVWQSRGSLLFCSNPVQALLGRADATRKRLVTTETLSSLYIKQFSSKDKNVYDVIINPSLHNDFDVLTIWFGQHLQPLRELPETSGQALGWHSMCGDMFCSKEDTACASPCGCSFIFHVVSKGHPGGW